MTTLLIKPWVLEGNGEKFRASLEQRGAKIKDFDIVRWIEKWIKDPSGSIWCRRISVPLVGKVYRARITGFKDYLDDGGFIFKGYIDETSCVIQSRSKLKENAKVRVIAVAGNRAECEVAGEDEEISSKTKIGYKFYYTAAGVTGFLEHAAWCNSVAELVGITPNEMMPTRVFADFERFSLPENINCKFVVYPESGKGNQSGYVLATECENCDGTSNVVCDRCDGSGRYRRTCRVCGGSGTIMCRRCGGSGHHVSGGTCYSCKGLGEHECWGCHGEGLSDRECNICRGTGAQKCEACHGTGVRRVNVDNATGELVVSGKGNERVRVSAKEIVSLPRGR